MKKSDLKTGMLVIQRNGIIRLLINQTFICSPVGMVELKDYNSDLTWGDKGVYDIVKVSNVLERGDLQPSRWSEQLIDANILWKEEVEIFACELDGVTYSESTLRSIIKKANSI